MFRQSGKLLKSVNMNGRWKTSTLACLHQRVIKLICIKINCLNLVTDDKHIVISQFVILNYSERCRIMIFDIGELGVLSNCTECVDSIYTVTVTVSFCGDC